MNREQAQEILSAYDPNRAPAPDGLFDEALRAAHDDPELDQWLQRELERDAQIRSALSEIRAPEGLKASILAAAEAREEPPKNIVAFPTKLLRIAAAIAVLVALVFTIDSMLDDSGDAIAHEPLLKNFRVAMAQRVQNGFGSLDYQGSEVPQIRSYIADTEPLAPETRPPLPYQDSTTFGCQILAYCDAKVTMVCYKRGAAVVHVYTIARSALDDEEKAPTTPRTEKIGKIQTATWSDQDYVFLACTESRNPDTLAELLATSLR